jgi:hypothetical protein
MRSARVEEGFPQMNVMPQKAKITARQALSFITLEYRIPSLLSSPLDPGGGIIYGGFYNAAMNSKQVKTHCILSDQAQNLIKMAMAELGLSARGYTKILKVSRTIADMAGSESILQEHISEAIQYRSLDAQL